MTLLCLHFDYKRTYILQTHFTYSNDKSVNCSMAEWRIEIAFFWHGWLRKMADVWSNGKRKIGKEIAFRGSQMLLVIQPRSLTLYNKNADISRSFFIDKTVNYTGFGTESRKKVHNFMQLFWKKSAKDQIRRFILLLSLFLNRFFALFYCTLLFSWNFRALREAQGNQSLGDPPMFWSVPDLVPYLFFPRTSTPVSYTHLTLPTILRV